MVEEEEEKVVVWFLAPRLNRGIRIKFSTLQRSPLFCAPGLVKFVAAVARLFRLALPGSFLNVFAQNKGDPCTSHNLPTYTFEHYLSRYCSLYSRLAELPPLAFSSTRMPARRQ